MSADDVLLRADRLPRVCLGDATPGTATKCSHTQTQKSHKQVRTNDKTPTSDKCKLVQPPTFREWKECLILRKREKDLIFPQLCVCAIVHNYFHVSICAFADKLHKNQKMHLGRSG